MNKIIFNILIVFFGLLLTNQTGKAQTVEKGLELVSVQKIWDKAPHNAFTDLVRFNDTFFCVFREGAKHVSDDGALRVIASEDGSNWTSAALITSADSDLRDAKITVAPNGQLMLSGAGALHDKSKHTHQSQVWFSNDGRNWSEKRNIGDPDFWLWRTTWYNANAYNFGYACGENKQLRLYTSKDGFSFETLVDNLNIEGYPNETSLVFKNDTAFCLLRRDGDKKSGLLGTSLPPYKSWYWMDLNVRIGGPHMILMPDGKLIAAVRLYEGDGWSPARTSLCKINHQTGKLTEVLQLPSGGDTSYAGLALFKGFLWVSYYSSHEEKTAIYLAKVRLNYTD